MILKLSKHFNGFFDKISSDQGLFQVCSRDQGKISLIKNLDPSRGWFYSPYESDYPLIYVTYALGQYVHSFTVDSLTQTEGTEMFCKK